MKWMEDMEDVTEMKFKEWWQKALDREEWQSVVKYGKAVRGPWSWEVSFALQFIFTNTVYFCYWQLMVQKHLEAFSLYMWLTAWQWKYWKLAGESWQHDLVFGFRTVCVMFRVSAFLQMFKAHRADLWHEPISNYLFFIWIGSSGNTLPCPLFLKYLKSGSLFGKTFFIRLCVTPRGFKVDQVNKLYAFCFCF